MMVKSVVIFGFGAAVGAISAYFVTKRMVENRCWNDYMGSRETEIKAEKSKNGVSKSENEAEDAEGVEKWAPSVSSGDLLAERNSTTALNEDLGYYSRPKKLDAGKKDVIDPYIIDEDQYASTDEYESEELDWWTAAKFATTENGGGVVPDVNGLVGIENILKIELSGEQYGYVRNEKLMRDYIIHINHDEPPIFLDDDD